MNRYLALGATVFFGVLLPLQNGIAQSMGGYASPGQMNRATVGDRTNVLVGGGISDSVASRMIKLSLSVEKTKGNLERISFQPDRVLLQTFDNHALLAWDFERSAQIAEFKLQAGSSPISYDKAGSRLLVLNNEALFSMTLSDKGEQASQKLSPALVTSAAAGVGQRSILVGDKEGNVSKLSGNGLLAWKKPLFGGRPVQQLVSDREGARFAGLAEGNEARLFEESGAQVAIVKEVARLGEITRSGILPLVLRSGQVATVSRKGVVTQHAPPGRIRSASLAPGGNSLLVVAESGEVSVGWATQWQPLEKEVKDAAFVSDKRFVVARGNGVVHLKEIGVPHYLVAIIPASSGWMIVDHEGRYDGTVDGGKDVKWSGDNTTLNLDQFFQSYYQPGLLAAYVGNDENRALQPVPANTGKGVFPPAKLDLQFPDGKMKAGQPMKVVAVAESTGGNLPEDIRLFHNGKRLPEKTRIGSQRVERDGKILLVQVFAFSAEAGVNEVFGEVRNAHGVGSRSDVTRETTEGFRSPGRLYLLGTGIDKYRNPEIDLDFAAVDVQAIVKNLNLRSRNTFQETIPKFILDAKATRKELLAELAQLEKLSAEDSVVLIFAGHGYAQDGEWYFLPHDVDTKRLKSTAVSAKEIQDALVNAPPKRIFMMVDACNSGAGIDSFNRFRSFQRRFVQEVGRNAGITVLTATRRDQQAAEMPELGHGVFTHAILEGLHGRAGGGTGEISAHQLANYVGENLERLARPYLSGLGLSQSPAHFVIGSDFVLGQASATDAAK